MAKTSRVEAPPKYSGDWTDMYYVTPREVDWLWYPFIPFGFITNIVGVQDAGKSSFISFVIAQTTTGRPFVHGEAEREPAGVCIIEDEQGDDVGVAPKLKANDSEHAPWRVLYLNFAVSRGSNGQILEEHFDVGKHVEILERQFRLSCEEKERCPIKLIVIDPVMSYMGNINTNDNPAVRRALLPLQRLIKEWSVACVMLNHFSKNEDRSIENKALGAGAFSQLARSEIIIHREKDDQKLKTDNRYVGSNKCNFGKMNNPPVYRFQIVDIDGFPKVCIDPKPINKPIEVLIEESGKKGSKRGPKESEAAVKFREWLDKFPNAAKKAAVVKASEFGVSKTQAYRIVKEVRGV